MQVLNLKGRSSFMALKNKIKYSFFLREDETHTTTILWINQVKHDYNNGVTFYQIICR